jgi:hypothetical protein
LIHSRPNHSAVPALHRPFANSPSLPRFRIAGRLVPGQSVNP